MGARYDPSFPLISEERGREDGDLLGNGKDWRQMIERNASSYEGDTIGSLS